MKLIVESGATKTDWVAVFPDKEPEGIRTPGINLASMSPDMIESVVMQAVDEFKSLGICDDCVEELFFYAAGLVGKEGAAVPDLAVELDKVLSRIFPRTRKEYSSDMLSAARAVCGHNPGIVAILGTGSNSCFFDGDRIVKNVPSGGFILGDEGGGARLGKLFVSDFIKGLVPEPVAGDFAREFEVDYPTVVKNVYRGGLLPSIWAPSPRGYSGSTIPVNMSRISWTGTSGISSRSTSDSTISGGIRSEWSAASVMPTWPSLKRSPRSTE